MFGFNNKKKGNRPWSVVENRFGVRAAIWRRQGSTKPVFTVSISKQYCGPKGIQHSHTFLGSELKSLQAVIEEACRRIKEDTP